jgi:hypothetical protein
VFTNGPSVIPLFNPSLRIYSYSPSTAVLSDYIQYYANLSQANQVGKLEYVKEYTARETYGMTSLVISEWQKVIQSLYLSTSSLAGNNLFEKYKEFFQVRSTYVNGTRIGYFNNIYVPAPESNNHTNVTIISGSVLNQFEPRGWGFAMIFTLLLIFIK